MTLEPTTGQERHDPDRLKAIEHMISVLWLVMSGHTAQIAGGSIADQARQYRAGVLGSLAEGQVPPPNLARTRHWAGTVMDHAVDSAEVADQLRHG